MKTSWISNFQKTIIPSILLTVFSWVLNSLITYTALSKGSYEKSDTFFVGNELFMALSIENYLSDSVDGLKISVPGSLKIGDISSDRPLMLSFSSNVILTSGKTIVEISSLPGKRRTTMILKLHNRTESGEVHLINSSEKGFSSMREIEHPMTTSLKQAGITTLAYVLVYFLFSFWFYTKQAELKNEISDLRKETDNRNSEIRTISQKNISELEELKKNNQASLDIIRSERETIKKESINIKIFTLSLISHYSKELDFWRNTIRSLICENKGDLKRSEKLFAIVSRNLQTFGTLKENSADFEYIVAMAKEFKANENGGHNKPDDLFT